jgi:hypothetical protein
VEDDLRGEGAAEVDFTLTERRAEVDERAVRVAGRVRAAQADRDRELEVHQARALDERLPADRLGVLLDLLAELRADRRTLLRGELLRGRRAGKNADRQSGDCEEPEVAPKATSEGHQSSSLMV